MASSELVLGRGEARRLGVLLAPAQEPAQAGPQLQEPAVVLVGGRAASSRANCAARRGRRRGEIELAHLDIALRYRAATSTTEKKPCPRCARPTPTEAKREAKPWHDLLAAGAPPRAPPAADRIADARRRAGARRHLRRVDRSRRAGRALRRLAAPPLSGDGCLRREPRPPAQGLVRRRRPGPDRHLRPRRRAPARGHASRAHAAAVGGARSTASPPTGWSTSSTTATAWSWPSSSTPSCERPTSARKTSSPGAANPA